VSLRAVVVLVAAVAGVPVMLGAAVLAPRWGAVRCLRALEAADPPDVQDPAGAPPAGLVLLADRARYGVRRAWLCRAPGPRPPVLVFVHGVTSRGLADGRVVKAVRAFARAGFTVLAPRMPTLVDPLAPEKVGAGLVRLLQAVAGGALERVDRRRIGLVGISVGASVALHAAAVFRRGGGRGLAAVLAVGAPDDLARLAPAWFAAPEPASKGDGSLAWERASDAAFARSFLLRAGLVARFGRTPDVRRVADWMAADPLPTAPPPEVADPKLRAAAALVRAPPKRRAAACAAVLRRAAARIRTLSPAGFDDELSSLRGVAVFLLHGRQDALVPVEEEARLARRLRAHTLVSVLDSPLLGHTAVGGSGWREELDLVVQVDDFFDMVGG
jgi:pimeloyl-ACP methyl ester carboxylesterase